MEITTINPRLTLAAVLNPYYVVRPNTPAVPAILHPITYQLS